MVTTDTLKMESEIETAGFADVKANAVSGRWLLKMLALNQVFIRYAIKIF